MYYRKEQWKEAIRMLVRMGSYAVLGVCMSAFILIPVMHLFLGGSRTSDGYQYDLLYDWSYYKKFHPINDKYLPDMDEGDTMANQIVTAINKLDY